MNTKARFLALLMAVSLVTVGASADVVTWGGGDGEYTDGANWVGGVVPDLTNGNTAVIGSGDVTYTAGPDLAIHNGGVLRIAGGSWTQAGGVAWMQLAGGTLDVAGGVFHQGTSGNIIRDVDTMIQVSAGEANFNGNFVYDPTNTGELVITGGAVNVANEFKPIGDFTMTAGELSCTLISFADGPGSILLQGGTVSVDGSGALSGFYGGGDKSVNFAVGSTGALRFETYTAAELAADGFLTNGTVQYNGTIDASAFAIAESGGGVTVTLVPEPASLGLVGLGGLLAAFRRRR